MTDSLYQIEAKKLLKKVRGNALTVEERRELAIELAALILKEAHRLQTNEERAHLSEIDQMVKTPRGKQFVTTLVDTGFRSQNPKKVFEQIRHVVGALGVPSFFSLKKKIGLHAACLFGSTAPFLLLPFARRLLRKESARVILPGEEAPLTRFLAKMRKQQIRVNLNRLGETILGEEQAERQVNLYLEDLQRTDVEYISVKISSICSKIHLLAWEETLSILKKRFESLLKAANRHTYKQANGKIVPKFINLDMEGYRDLHVTVELFKSVLDQPQFFRTSAGIVLQSYIPDAHLVQQEITAWATLRVANGGAPIKIRLVKGANLGTERVEASLEGWEQAPYANKAQADANYKKMLLYALQPERIRAVHIGIGSHNLFEIAYALLASEENQVAKRVEIEMLAGMAEPIQRAVHALKGSILLYCPVAKEEEFNSALSYLMRRFDESTGPNHFLTHLFGLFPGTEEWQNQCNHFSLSCHLAENVPATPRRDQNRFHEEPRCTEGAFYNEPSTDWTLVQNRKWLETSITEFRNTLFEPVPLVIDGEEIHTSTPLSGFSPASPSETLYPFSSAPEEEIKRALEASLKAQSSWGGGEGCKRCEFIVNVGKLLRQKRAELIVAMMGDCGKTAEEADVEISEAIDFAEYYRRELIVLTSNENLAYSPVGPILVASPWNFPCSIPVGGICSALLAGNTVLFKPAVEAVFVGWKVASIFWEAGIDKKTLQFVPTEDEPGGSLLVQDKRVASVILTGATETAKHFLKLRPSLHLVAETGGKNSIIVSSLADRDLAVQAIIQSAFQHAGQKCSACSLAILEREVYEDERFLETLRDASKSLTVGDPWNLATEVPPLIRPPDKQLLRALTTLEQGERWLLEPKVHPDNPNLWSPGIKLGVREKSFTHMTELFGPILGVMCAESLDHAIEIANQTPYGLTGGIHTLDEGEKAKWLQEIAVGNAYINRTITGAVVQRQPFGGCKNSHFGPGGKAGGPNYLPQFMQVRELSPPQGIEELPPEFTHLTLQAQRAQLTEGAIERVERGMKSYVKEWETRFALFVDKSHVVGEENLFSYRPLTCCYLRLEGEIDPKELVLCLAASKITKTPLKISSNQPKPEWLHEISWKVEDLFSFEPFDDPLGRVRLLRPPSEELAKQLAEKGVCPVVAPVFTDGQLELTRWLREISLSHTTHRYGSLTKNS